MKIIGKMNVGGRAGWVEDRVAKMESDNKTEWELLADQMNRWDDERGPLTRKERRPIMSRET